MKMEFADQAARVAGAGGRAARAGRGGGQEPGPGRREGADAARPPPGVRGRRAGPVPAARELAGQEQSGGVPGARPGPQPHGGREGGPRGRCAETGGVLHSLRRGLPDVLHPGSPPEGGPDMQQIRHQVFHWRCLWLSWVHVCQPG
ncbi:uncharacterized protein PHA67_002848 [Liasis olivaceus]